MDNGKALLIPLALKLRFQAETPDVLLLQGATKPTGVLGVLCAFARNWNFFSVSDPSLSGSIFSRQAAKPQRKAEHGKARVIPLALKLRR